MTLAAQGGPMSDHEVAAFEAGEDVWAKVELRVADDGAKVPGRVVSPLATYEDALRSLAASFTGR
jgi:predicted HD phosphohydrolase